MHNVGSFGSRPMSCRVGLLPAVPAQFVMDGRGVLRSVWDVSLYIFSFVGTTIEGTTGRLNLFSACATHYFPNARLIFHMRARLLHLVVGRNGPTGKYWPWLPRSLIAGPASELSDYVWDQLGDCAAGTRERLLFACSSRTTWNQNRSGVARLRARLLHLNFLCMGFARRTRLLPRGWPRHSEPSFDWTSLQKALPCGLAPPIVNTRTLLICIRADLVTVQDVYLGTVVVRADNPCLSDGGMNFLGIPRPKVCFGSAVSSLDAAKGVGLQGVPPSDQWDAWDFCSRFEPTVVASDEAGALFHRLMLDRDIEEFDDHVSVSSPSRH
jgi:hypothetical protein